MKATAPDRSVKDPRSLKPHPWRHATQAAPGPTLGMGPGALVLNSLVCSSGYQAPLQGRPACQATVKSSPRRAPGGEGEEHEG